MFDGSNAMVWSASAFEELLSASFLWGAKHLWENYPVLAILTRNDNMNCVRKCQNRFWSLLGIISFSFSQRGRRFSTRFSFASSKSEELRRFGSDALCECKCEKDEQ
jgi:hypothetical protein